MSVPGRGRAGGRERVRGQGTDAPAPRRSPDLGAWGGEESTKEIFNE